MLIGEAEGEAEEKAFKLTGVHTPFVGLAGKVLDGILEEVGLPRALCTITNVMHERPAGNDFSIYYDEDKNPTPELLQAYERLKNEIVVCQPNVIVCLGNEAMKAVVGHGGVMDWRGSVLHPPGLGIKVIPTIHPAAVLREWSFRPAVVSDFYKIAKESEHGELHTQKRQTKINPRLDEVLGAIEEAKRAEWCAIDIETETNQITCIGLSYKPNEAICIPFWFGASGSLWSEQDEQLIWMKLKELLESDGPKKIAHNAMYELEYLTRTMGIRPKIHFDTMLAFHVLYSELPKTLAYLVSVYTDHPYYKFQRRTDKMDELWHYNATDAMLTFECAWKLLNELEEEGQLNFYYQYEHALLDPLFSMTVRGVKFDHARRKELKKQYEDELSVLQEKLNNLVGHPLNIGSNLQMTKWLYDELKLPKKLKLRKGTGSKTLSADEEALTELYREHKIEAIEVVLTMRERQKILSTYLNVEIDDDERIRCAYNIGGTETGRLSSSATALGTGTNLQNIPDGDVRSLLVADEGYVFINADLSQAEARVVAYLSEDQRLLEVFSSGGDIHTRNASKMFNKTEGEVTKDERFLAKRAVHGLNYGMGYVTFAKETGIERSTAQRVYNIYFSTFPRLKLWHMKIRNTLDKTRILTTPFGRKRIFFNRWSDQLLKEGLAYIPQSTVAEIVNQAIIKLDHRWGQGTDKQLLLQVHDSILAQVRLEHLDEAIKEIKEAMTYPLEINGKWLTIPVDVKTGMNWRDLK